jgi:glycosyltransferase involved in cell wall biosynthesis
MNGDSRKQRGRAVTVVTPVYNGGKYLSDCIESVIRQSFQDWNYFIVNNRSTDNTLEIAQQYAQADSRIHVVTNDTFLSMAGNFNRAFSLVPADARYVKAVCADDWILPDCLTELVRFADDHPSVGIVGCHQQSGDVVRWKELPAHVEFLPGKEACRLALLKGLQIFGAPTAFLYRADMIREGPFFPTERPNCDTSACFEKLDRWDFGVVHKLLSVERVHSGQVSSNISDVAAGDVAYLEAVMTYGPRYLDESEFATRAAEVYAEYCRGLGRGVLNFKGKKFWDYQRSELAKLGLKIDYGRVVQGTLSSIWANATRPAVAGRKLRTVLSQKMGR